MDHIQYRHLLGPLVTPSEIPMMTGIQPWFGSKVASSELLTPFTAESPSLRLLNCMSSRVTSRFLFIRSKAERDYSDP
jgi:hypothetical protein